MRNKIFTKKLNDFNFYTFDEYLNDNNDKMFTKSLLSIPYFNSFIQKAKNTLYQKDVLRKRANSKNNILKTHKIDMNNDYVLTSHLTSNSNSIFAYNYHDRNNNQIKNVKKSSFKNLSYTPDNITKYRRYITTKPKNKHNYNKNKFYLYKKKSNTPRGHGPDIRPKSNINNHRKKYFSAERDLTKTENNNDNKNYNYNSVSRFKQNINNRNNRITNNLTSYNNKINVNKKYMNDISENEESISSFSINEENNQNKVNMNINIIVNKKAIDNKFKKFLEEEKSNKSKKTINSQKKDNNIIETVTPYNNKGKINNQIINEKNEKNKIEGKIKNNKNSKKNNNNEILKELNEFIPIDLYYIINLPVNIIIQKVKKYLKKNGYFCNDKNNIIKGNKGNSNIEITLYKLKYLKDDSVYFSVKIKSQELKNEKVLIREMINNLKK